jgi:hypothetical protein
MNAVERRRRAESGSAQKFGIGAFSAADFR